MSQPNWEPFARVGDTLPDYDGGFIFTDATNVYDAEVEWVETPPEDKWDPSYRQGSDFKPSARWIAYRFSLDRRKWILDPNHDDGRRIFSYHEWYDDDLAAVAASMGTTAPKIRTALCSKDPVKRFWAYQSIAGYHGYQNFDSYPLRLTEAEVNARYADAYARLPR